MRTSDQGVAPASGAGPPSDGISPMPRRVPIRLVRLLAVACACLAPAAGAQAAPPPNDVPSAAQAVTGLLWTSLSVPQDILVTAADWGEAATGPEDADPLPSCTGVVGFRSMWYSVAVAEASVLRVTVLSTDNARYQPVVTILDPATDEVGCGIASISKSGATANATAYVTPGLDGNPATYRIRVAQFGNNSPSGGQPVVTVRFAGRDVTAPHIRLTFPDKTVPPGAPSTYDATATTDGASQVNPGSAKWEFHDKVNGRSSIRTRTGLSATYSWVGAGSHNVVFRVSDFAGNESMYRFTTLVQDTVRPDIKFSLKPPRPASRRLQVRVDASESVHVRLVVTQAGRATPLMRRTLNFWGDRSQARSVMLRGAVGKGLLFITGFARDLAGNTSALPQCVVDPVTGQGRCTPP
jgi:hypothetical protein